MRGQFKFGDNFTKIRRYLIRNRCLRNRDQRKLAFKKLIVGKHRNKKAAIIRWSVRHQGSGCIGDLDEFALIIA